MGVVIKRNPPSSTLTLSDLTYLGAYRVPNVTPVNSAETRYGSGLALRYESSDGVNQVHLISGAYGGSAIFAGCIVEWRDITPTIPGSPYVVGSYSQASILKDYGNIFSNKRLVKYLGNYVDFTAATDGAAGYYWDPVDDRLYHCYAETYSNEVPQYSIMYCTLNYGAQTGAGFGPWRLSTPANKATDTGVVPVPSTFASTYLGGSAVRLAAGFGGYGSLAGTGDVSLGPSLTAFTPPINGATEQTSITGTPLVGYYPADSIPSTGDRMTRPVYVIPGSSYVNPDEQALWGDDKCWWIDRCPGGVWIHGNTKSGFITFMNLGMGLQNYISSQIASEWQRYYMAIYSEADLALVAQGEDPYNIQPSSVEELQFGTIDYSTAPYTGGTPVSITSITSSSSDHVDGSDGATNTALVTTSSPHGITTSNYVGIRGTTRTEFHAVWSVSNVPSATTLHIKDTSTNPLTTWSGVTATGGETRIAGLGVDRIVGATFDPSTNKLYVGVSKLEGVNNSSGQLMIHVYLVDC